jgi:polysaccharide biosynthesis protein PslH
MARNVMDLPVPHSILFQHNVEAEILKRHATVDLGRLRRAFMRGQYRKMRSFEGPIGRRFSAVIAVSERDRQAFLDDYGWPNTYAIETAVDTQYFTPMDGLEALDRVLFVGSMDWMPNSDGVRYFVQEVWPLIREARTAAEFHIVGRNPSRSVCGLAAVPGVKVLGTVRDVRPHLSEASAVVVPLRIGGGTRIKIFEAMAMNKAVISTSIGAEGLDVRHQENILLADNARAFADSVIQVLENCRLRKTLGENGRELVVSRFGTEPVARQFYQICHDVCKKSQLAEVGT